jgi:hypothetical protein
MTRAAQWTRRVTETLLRRTLVWMTPEQRVWGNALLAELTVIEGLGPAVEWALGGIRMILWLRLRQWRNDRWLWVLALALGSLAAYVDLQSATRRPLVLLLPLFAGTIAFLRPRDPWRWALAVAMCLPAITGFTGFWGPYFYDRGDTFYGLVPALVGSALGAWMRRQFDPPEAGNGAEVQSA